MPSNVNLNGVNVAASVFDASGAEASDALRPDEIVVIQAADRLLKGDPQFKASYPSAILERIESYRGVGDTEHGRYYLRYQPASGAATEFWAHVGKTTSINFKSGSVSVPGAGSPG